jgi:hypothetical protein
MVDRKSHPDEWCNKVLEQSSRRQQGLLVSALSARVLTQTATRHTRVRRLSSQLAKDREVMIHWIFSPQAGVLVVMAQCRALASGSP